MAGANTQFQPKGLGEEKRTRARVRKAGQPSEGKIEEGREEQTGLRGGRRYSRDVSREHS